jgi:hypothetical protein
MPVQELYHEAYKALDLVGQQVVIALTDFGSSDSNIKQASKTLVETTLENIAPSLYRGCSLAYADISTHSNMMHKIGVTRE